MQVIGRARPNPGPPPLTLVPLPGPACIDTPARCWGMSCEWLNLVSWLHIEGEVACICEAFSYEVENNAGSTQS